MPGSGKSYIQKVILKNLKLKNYYNYYNDYKILNRFSKILFFLQFLLSYPIFSLKTLFLIKLSKQQANEKINICIILLMKHHYILISIH